MPNSYPVAVPPLRYVVPSLAYPSIIDRGLRDSESGSEFFAYSVLLLCRFTESFPDFLNHFRIEFCHRASTFLHHVTQIIFLSTNKQMERVHASPVVASVTREQIGWNWLYEKFVGYSMPNHPCPWISRAKACISVPRFISNPIPAVGFFRVFYLLNKTLHKWLLRIMRIAMSGYTFGVHLTESVSRMWPVAISNGTWFWHPTKIPTRLFIYK